mmetsp:Transcript_7453/g.6716  ORF Transcript_7453/g.6716 Transcript_7453/m.6716 type:complete len:271 (-) Transcript_7453:144-956(-)
MKDIHVDLELNGFNGMKTQKLNLGSKGMKNEMEKKFERTQKDMKTRIQEAKTKNIEIAVSLSPKSNDKRSNDSRTHSKERPKNLVPKEEVKFPLKPGQALKSCMSKLTDFEKGEILDYKMIYFIGSNAKKIKGSPAFPFNYGYDDDRGDYKVVIKDHIGYRFEVLEFLGKGSFGQALKCLDHKTNETVAVKLIRNKKRFQHQAGVELKILQHLRDSDPDDSFNIIRIKDFLVFRKHLVISFELCSINLYEFIKGNNFQGVGLSLIRRFAI